MERTRRPSTPGEILRELYLEPLGMSITAFAERIGVSRKTVSSIINGRTPVTVDMALRLSRAFDTTPDLWLNLQQSIDIWTRSMKAGAGRGYSPSPCPLVAPLCNNYGIW